MTITTLEPMIRGTTRRWRVAVKDNSGQPVDLTGAAVYFTIRKKGVSVTAADDSDAVLQKSIAGGIEATDAAAGQLKITLDPTDTRNKAAAKYIYDLCVITAAGERIVPAAGELEVRAEVTRRAT